METLKEVLMERDGITEEEADELIEEARMVLEEYIENGNIDNAYEICAEMFGLEPDYLLDLFYQ